MFYRCKDNDGLKRRGIPVKVDGCNGWAELALHVRIVWLSSEPACQTNGNYTKPQIHTEKCLKGVFEWNKTVKLRLKTCFWNEKKMTGRKCSENIPCRFLLKRYTWRKLEWLSRGWEILWDTDVEVKMLISYRDFCQQLKGESTRRRKYEHVVVKHCELN